MKTIKLMTLIAAVAGLLFSGTAFAGGSLTSRGITKIDGKAYRVYHDSGANKIMRSDGAYYPVPASSVYCLGGACVGLRLGGSARSRIFHLDPDEWVAPAERIGTGGGVEPAGMVPSTMPSQQGGSVGMVPSTMPSQQGGSVGMVPSTMPSQ